MAAKKVDFRELVVEGFYTVRALLSQLFGEFGKRDRYFKYKVGIVAVWLAVSLASVAVATGGGPRTNSLHAFVGVTQVAGDTILQVRNGSGGDWKQVHLTLNGQYSAYQPLVTAGEKLPLSLKQFVGPGGAMPPPGMRPRSLRISSNEGSDRIDLTQKPHDGEVE